MTNTHNIIGNTFTGELNLDQCTEMRRGLFQGIAFTQSKCRPLKAASSRET